jgi:hypothetical protein
VRDQRESATRRRSGAHLFLWGSVSRFSLGSGKVDWVLPASFYPSRLNPFCIFSHGENLFVCFRESHLRPRT